MLIEQVIRPFKEVAITEAEYALLHLICLFTNGCPKTLYYQNFVKIEHIFSASLQHILKIGSGLQFEILVFADLKRLKNIRVKI